jgi:hypothetical protein
MTRWMLAPALVLALPLAASAGRVTVPDANVDKAYASRRVALLIGVDDYEDAALQPLAFAGKDANDVAAALKSPTVGGYDQVVVLTGPQATSRAGILKAIKDVTANLQRDDTFLLYLSGHGTLTLDPIEGTQLWFLPSDAELATPSADGIQVAWLEQTLTSLTPKRRVLIMDTCHNGRADGSRAALNGPTQDRLASLRGEPPAPNPVAEVTESEARLYAAQYYQPAMEDKALGNGVYTHYLLQAMTGDRGSADLDRDGLVDVTEAHDYAQERTIRHTGGLQVPRAEYRIVGRESIFLSGDPSNRVRAENALVSAYNGLLASARLFVDGQSRGALPGVVAIEPGRHHIEIQTSDGRTIYAERVTMSAGQHLQVEDLMEPESAQVTVALGAVAGHSSDSLATWSGELEVGYRPAVRGDWRPTLYARVPLGQGRAPSDSTLPATVFMPSAGLFLGVQAHERVLVGPELEAVLYMRNVTCDACASIEAPQYTDWSGTVAPGLRAEVVLAETKAGDVTARYDVRALPFRMEQDDAPTTWTVGVAHGLSLGAAF